MDTVTTEQPVEMTYAEQYCPVWVIEVLDLADRI